MAPRGVEVVVVQLGHRYLQGVFDPESENGPGGNDNKHEQMVWACLSLTSSMFPKERNTSRTSHSVSLKKMLPTYTRLIQKQGCGSWVVVAVAGRRTGGHELGESGQVVWLV